MRDYILHCESPRRYGLGKFALFMPRLIGNGAALHQCTGDFIVAVGSLVDHVPNRLAKRMIACAVELRRLHPDPGHQLNPCRVGHGGDNRLETRDNVAKRDLFPSY